MLKIAYNIDFEVKNLEVCDLESAILNLKKPIPESSSVTLKS